MTTILHIGRRNMLYPTTIYQHSEILVTTILHVGRRFMLYLAFI
ncbi:hypothetical protein ACR56S_11780 [Staphylococcus hominis]